MVFMMKLSNTCFNNAAQKKIPERFVLSGIFLQKIVFSFYYIRKFKNSKKSLYKSNFILSKLDIINFMCYNIYKN